MSSFISSLKNHRAKSRDNRAIARIVDGMGSPAMRDELIIMAQRSRPAADR